MTNHHRHPANAESRYTKAGGLVAELVIETFRLNGAFIAAGNRLGEGIGITTARWQVIAALTAAGKPLTVSRIARAMGLTRQSVQRVVDELERDGFVERSGHPEHRSARLVAVTEAGRDAEARVMTRQRPWANWATNGIAAGKLASALELMRDLRQRLEGEKELAASESRRRTASQNQLPKERKPRRRR